MVSKTIYFDNSATTPLCREAKEALYNVYENVYGNPSSVHGAGVAANKILSDARETLLSSIGAAGNKKLIFCGSGSEANNLAILGTARAKKHPFTPRFVLGSGEHSSVEQCARALEAEGFEIVRVSTEKGEINEKELKAALTKNTVLVSFMLVNNETGALYDVKSAFALAKSLCPEAVTHCDAVQGYLKVPIKAGRLGADLITVSAHKINGPKGVGALFADDALIKAKKIVPVIYGGGQEEGLRSGTQNVAGISGFAAAAKRAFSDLRSFGEVTDTLCNRIIDKISASALLSGTVINRGESHAPHILSITLPDVKSETMLNFLSARGIYVSNGSACSSRSKKSSPALAAFGLDKDSAARTIRVSLSLDNTEEEVDIFVSSLAEGLSALIGYKK